MSITNKRGSVFSLDVLFAFLAASAILVFAINAESSFLLTHSKDLKTFELQEKALMIADSLVKNNDSNNSLLGSAFFDSEKCRVVSNLVDLEGLKKAKQVSFGSIIVSEVFIQKKGESRELVFSNELEVEECFAVNRFVLLQQSNEKVLVGVVVCEV